MNEKVIEVKGLKKHFGKVKAVDGIDFDVEKGEVFGFLGPNGAGKTTTIRCLMDFIRPQEGEARVLGRDARMDSVELKKSIGYLAGDVRLYDKWTGREHIRFMRRLNGGKNVAAGLTKKFDFDPEREVKDLSSGNKQKLGLIMALMFEPELLILDEPTSGLDPLLQNTVHDMLEEASEKGTTIFMSSHIMPEVERACDRVGIIRQGKMAATESIVAMKEKKIYRVTAYFKEKADAGLFAGEGVEVVREHGHEIILRVKGEIDPVIKELSKHGIKDIDITQASLEDIFLEYYKK